MDWLFDPTAWIGLATLIVLEIVLGVDNLIFIAIITDKLPPERRGRARLVGLSFALGMRLALLASISWLVGLTRPLFTIAGFGVSGRQLVSGAGDEDEVVDAEDDLENDESRETDPSGRVEGPGHGRHLLQTGERALS